MAARTANPWRSLFVRARVAATAVAAALLIFHRVTDHDGLYALVVVAYGAATAAAVATRVREAGLAAFWLLDGAATLALVMAGGNWRSPVYLLALTALILPATAGPPWRGVAATGAFTCGYLAIALFTGVDWDTLDTTPRLESFSTHLLLPLLLGIGLAYMAELLRRLERERARSSQLALEAERRRLARELHDSAKQRIHAAHLLLSSLPRNGDGAAEHAISLALGELEEAGSEMDSSLADLRTAVADATLMGTVRRRAARLQAATGIPIEVIGDDASLTGSGAIHAYHVVSEAMTNAVRHAHPSMIRVSLRVDGGRLAALVEDDGKGLPTEAPWDSQGIRSMVERAEFLGGSLAITGHPAGGTGTQVRLTAPIDSMLEGAP
ncbi:MAG TPA: ATP-binding protein [Thermoleophilaceae bacterium]|nr:ATP-binding protein [Thermoleophilaceae bacterium]